MENLTYKQASRFLDLATMGVRPQDVDDLLSLDSKQAWLEQQLTAPFAVHTDRVAYQKSQRGETESTQEMRVGAWFDIAFWSGAQLRQRMAFALSQIVVVNDRDAQLAPYPEGVANYYDLLTKYAFSDYKTLLYHVTRSPIMGHFLTMVGNLPKSETGVNPDQNYAREVMQLFTIGLEELNLDGTKKLDTDGLPIATYDDTDIENMARVFTGWFMSNGSMLEPMVADDTYHDQNAKTILGQSVPAGLSAEQELDTVLDILVNHPNTAPFISKFLIQRFVTSNPLPEYVQRVANVFIQTRGNLGEVITAILLDPQVDVENSVHRAKLREPILAMTHLCRALDCKPGNNGLITYDALLYRDTFNQYPLGAPSVFNFYSPDHQPPGALAEQGLASPELEIIDWNQVIKMSNLTWKLVQDNGYKTGSNSKQELYPQVSDFTNIAGDYNALVTLICNRFFHGELPTDIAPRLEALWSAKNSNNKPYAVAPMIYLAFVSPNFMVQE
ncbi:DUF1800 domain-containing protein [Vibrio mexicanus]|uniref:DUF1800 domain-containing protein n=1 Tax=Vibrio mexicanus TaxID=1004326 RepID=UPI00063C7826|nr:DUF1800 family protein [Vibrio mexicanus]